MDKLTKNKEMISICLAAFFISSCSSNQDQKTQDLLLNLQTPPHKCFTQVHENKFHPPEYVTCDKYKKQCCWANFHKQNCEHSNLIINRSKSQCLNCTEKFSH